MDAHLTGLLAEIEHHVSESCRIATVGTRRLDDDGRRLCAQVGSWAVSRGHTIVSGAAEGADLAFMSGARDAGGQVVAVLPWASYNAGLIPEGCERLVYDPARHGEWAMLAAAHHPAWDLTRSDGRPILSRGSKALHARNTGILLGEAPPERVALVVAHPAGNRRGGTEQALRLAEHLGIPVVRIG